MTDITSNLHKTSLTLYRSSKYPELVVAAGYKDTKFGYFLCQEEVTASESETTYEYGNILGFYVKVDDDTYQRAITDLEKLVALL